MANASSRIASFVTSSVELMLDTLRPQSRMGLLISSILMVLLLVSWIATMTGISNLAGGQGLNGDLGTLFLSVVGSLSLTILMWVMLERARLPGPPFARAACCAFYLFLLIWTFGFGYSFWWSVIAARAESVDGLHQILDNLDNSLTDADAKLTAISQGLDDVQKLSAGRASTEDTVGNTCGPPSGVGQGQLWAARRGVNDAISLEVQSIQSNWIANVRQGTQALRADLSQMNKDASQPSSDDRNSSLQSVYNEAKGEADKITTINATNAKSTAARLNIIASTLENPPGSVNFKCYDPSLASMLRQAAETVSVPISITVVDWKPTEGKAATDVAFLRLWGTFFTPLLKVLGVKHLPKDGLHGRDWIALLAGIAFDLGILALTMVRPRPGGQTFMGSEAADEEAQSRLDNIIRKYREPARSVLYDMYFPVGRKQYIAIPDVLWTGPKGMDPRSYHLAMAALGNRLAASRLTDPPKRLVDLATKRLSLLGWFPAGTSLDTPTATRWRALVKRLAQGTMLPDHPIIFSIADQDRDAAIRILDDAQSISRKPPPDRTSGIAVGAQRPSPSPEVSDSKSPAAAGGPSNPNVPDWVDDVYAAALGFEQRGKIAEAEGMLQIIRSQMNNLRTQGFEVHGLDGVVGKKFDPNMPFSAIGQEESAEPAGTILRVLSPALTLHGKGRKRILKEGRVVVSSGAVKHEQRAAQSSSTAPIGEHGLEASMANSMDPQSWMPDDDG